MKSKGVKSCCDCSDEIKVESHCSSELYEKKMKIEFQLLYDGEGTADLTGKESVCYAEAIVKVKLKLTIREGMITGTKIGADDIVALGT